MAKKQKRKGLLGKAIDAVTSRDEKAAAEVAAEQASVISFPFSYCFFFVPQRRLLRLNSISCFACLIKTMTELLSGKSISPVWETTKPSAGRRRSQRYSTWSKLGQAAIYLLVSCHFRNKPLLLEGIAFEPMHCRIGMLWKKSFHRFKANY